MKKKIVVFTGAGISAESGIPTFRDNEGLWNKHIADEVASMSGWKKDKEKVLKFHNEFAKEFSKCEPNDAHKTLAKLEERYDVTVVTQNIDNLHERGGSTNVIHVHGNIAESKSSMNPNKTYPLSGDIKLGDKADDNSQLRHNTVLFGESLPTGEFKKAMKAMENADFLIIVGTSLVVFPAADLIKYFHGEQIYVIDPNNVNLAPAEGRTFIVDKATRGTKWLYDKLMA